MAYVVGTACEDCKDTACVTVCPVDAFHEDDRRLYIDPDVCICCAACVPECPTEAIFDESDPPAGQESQVALNLDRVASGLYPNIVARKPPLRA